MEAIMRFRPLLALTLLAAVFPAALTLDAAIVRPRQQTSIIRFERPTWVAKELLIGSYMIVHDDARMARGEPCTAIYRLGGSISAENEVVAFHCIPRERKLANTFQMTVDSSLVPGTDTLVEYQFAGDSEGHGVPLIKRALNSVHTETTPVCLK
jgi:hypothetical protein